MLVSTSHALSNSDPVVKVVTLGLCYTCFQQLSLGVKLFTLKVCGGRELLHINSEKFICQMVLEE